MLTYVSKNVQLLAVMGCFVPQTPTGALPLDHTGELLSPDRLLLFTPTTEYQILPTPLIAELEYIVLFNLSISITRCYKLHERL